MNYQHLDAQLLYLDLDEQRKRWGISWRELGRITGLPTSTFTRMKAGHMCFAHSLAAILLWLGNTDLAPYIVGPDVAVASEEEL